MTLVLCKRTVRQFRHIDILVLQFKIMPGRKWWSKEEADEKDQQISELEQAVIKQKNRDIKILIIGTIGSGLFGYALCTFF